MLRKLILIFAVANFVFADPTTNRRIIGGGTAGLGQMPYIASVRSWGTTFHFAGGALISDRWILTSANYLIDRANDSLNIVFGIVDLASEGTSRRSELITTHPSYDSTTRHHDIACIRMVTPSITFTATVNAIFMVPEIVGFATIAQTGGWGATEPNKGDNSQLLRRLDVRVTDCRTFGPYWPHSTANMCTSPLTTGGICTSDVGGPMVTLAGLVGIASWHNVPCATGTDVFVRISFYRNWIGSVTGV